MIIYRCINIINNKSYIGLTKNNFIDRIGQHINTSIKCPKSYFHSALNKYGPENFTWEIIDSDATSVDHLKRLEVWYIEHLKPEYNMTKGGDGVIGLECTLETRKKLSNVWKGKKRKPFTLDHKLNMSKSKKGKKRKPHNEETKKKIGNIHKGKVVSYETRQKQSIAHKNKKLTDLQLFTLRNNFKGRKHTPETKRKVGLRHLTNRRKQLILLLKEIQSKHFFNF